MKAKQRRKTEREIETFLKFEEMFGGYCRGSRLVSTEKGGMDITDAFFNINTLGNDVLCDDPVLLQRAIGGKANLNMHIKMWAEGILEIPLQELTTDPQLSWLPEWVWKAMENQCKKNWLTQSQKHPAWMNG